MAEHTSFQCPEGNTDQCEEYKCRKSGVCKQPGAARQLKEPLALSRPLRVWRCASCGQYAEDCTGHRWGGVEGVQAPVVCHEPPQA
jgi:hypothetical protein